MPDDASANLTSGSSPSRVELASLAATERLAAEVVAHTAPGALLVLTGPLGSGKTTLTQLIAQRLGSTASVTSPSYTLVHEYPTAGGLLVHIDAYRLASAQRLAALGLDDYLARARLVVVEWGAELLPDHPEALWLELSLEVGLPSDEEAGADPVVRRFAAWRDPADYRAAAAAGDGAAGHTVDPSGPR